MLSVKIPNKFSHDLESNNEREREISIFYELSRVHVWTK